MEEQNFDVNDCRSAIKRVDKWVYRWKICKSIANPNHPECIKAQDKFSKAIRKLKKCNNVENL